MIKVKLPVYEQCIKDDKIITKKTEKEVQLDFSVYAEMRWEQNFPNLAEKEGLFEYLERLKNKRDKNKNLERAASLSIAKAIYCLIESDWTFKEFAQMLSLSDDFTKHLHKIMELALQSSAEKN